MEIRTGGKKCGKQHAKIVELGEKVVEQSERIRGLERALEKIATMEPYQHSATCIKMHGIANEALRKGSQTEIE